MEELRQKVGEMFLKHGLTGKVIELNKKLDELVNVEQRKILQKINSSKDLEDI